MGAFHDGVDYAPNDDYNVYLPLAGKVIFAGYRTNEAIIDSEEADIEEIKKNIEERAEDKYRGDGYVVSIDHGNGVVSEYCHLEKVMVNVEDELKQGDIIGIIGETGYVTGKCLHWRVFINGETVNPMDYIK